MQESVQHREISFADLFRIVFRKFYVVLLAVILAAGIGATYAYSKNNGVKLYGATANYKIAVLTDIQDAEGNPLGLTTGYNFLYNQQHLTMLVDELKSDKFVSEKIVDNLVEKRFSELETDEEKEAYYGILAYVKSCIFYSYDSERNPNSVFVTVRVVNNKLFAEKLLSMTKSAVREYIQKNMIRPAPEVSYAQDGSIASKKVYSTECTELTMSRIRLLNAGQTKSAMLKYAILAGFLAAMIVCITLIVLDYTDTRLRDPEDVAKRNAIPNLGVIPAHENKEVGV